MSIAEFLLMVEIFCLCELLLSLPLSLTNHSYLWNLCRQGKDHLYHLDGRSHRAESASYLGLYDGAGELEPRL